MGRSGDSGRAPRGRARPPAARGPRAAGAAPAEARPVSAPAELRRLPSVDRLLGTPEARALLERFARPLVTDVLRAILDERRRALRGPGAGAAPPLDPAALVGTAAAQLARLAAPALTPVVNATGVLLHTNLGRAPLAEEAVAALVAAARAPVALEYDLATGGRGERDDLVAADLAALTGAPAATVVNNNAAALVLALNTLAEGREAVVSRGELIEIGGSFRIPEILAKSGARLREVGTTNRTHLADYRAAIGPETGVLLKVHTSNYRVVGFTSAVPVGELVALGRTRGLPVIEDLGSGALVDLSTLGLPKEPVVREQVAAGVDLVTFSADKLLGGPQAGIVTGRADLVARVRANPLRRALRPDKLTLAALLATLRLYRTAPDLTRAFPILRAACRPLASVEETAYEAAELVARALGPDYRIALVESECEIGSGALPDAVLPSRALAITGVREGADAIARRFRAAAPPIIGRVRDGAFLLDVRAIGDPALLVPRASGAGGAAAPPAGDGAPGREGRG
jgi:L-seryl-tRNA(Ser) seleniumtransferase